MLRAFVSIVLNLVILIRRVCVRGADISCDVTVVFYNTPRSELSRHTRMRASYPEDRAPLQ